MKTSKKPLLIRDPIYGDMILPSIIKPVIDHPLYQRLRGITQNSLLYLIFPSARHTRFEHSLGVCFISIKWYNGIFDKMDNNRLEVLKQKANRRTDGTVIELALTDRVLTHLKTSKKDKTRWQNIISIAAILHDIGHGPFSHLLEETELLTGDSLLESAEKYQDKIRCVDLIGFLKEKYQSKNTRVEHEDISLIYASILFHDLQEAKEDKFFSHQRNLEAILCLISKNFKKYYLDKKQGKEALRIILFAPMVSGFIDVDRIDYIKRDCYFSGVSYGSIETERLMYSLTPVLTKRDDGFSSTFLCRFNDAHMVDHFLIALYEVYAQLIFHPKNIQYGHEICLLIEAIKADENQVKVVFPGIRSDLLTWYKNTQDHDFVRQLESVKNDKAESIVKKILHREYTYGAKCLVQLPLEEKLVHNVGDHYENIGVKARSLIKDGNDLWLYSNVGTSYHIYHWNRNSLVAAELKNQKFQPIVWWRHDALKGDIKKADIPRIEEAAVEMTSTEQRKRKTTA